MLWQRFFAECFVGHRRIRLSPHEVAELALESTEGRFDVAPLVIVGLEFLPLELEIVVHLGPQSATPSGVNALERDERRCAMLLNRGIVAQAAIRLFAAERFAMTQNVNLDCNPKDAAGNFLPYTAR